MELPHIGTHCAESTCRKLDFLPFTCNLCNKDFCVDHHKYEAHNCSRSHEADVQVPICPLCEQPVPSKRGQPPDLAVNVHIQNNCKHKHKKIYTNKCSAAGCKTKEMVPVNCDSCHQNFCLRHRHAADHDCKGPMTARERALAAASARASSQSNNNKKKVSSSGETRTSSSSSRQQSIQRYFSPSTGSPRPTGHSLAPRAANLSSLQGGMTEEEALARALAASVQESSGSSDQAPSALSQEDEDSQLALAIAASMQEQPPHTSSQSERISNSCSVS